MRVDTDSGPTAAPAPSDSAPAAANALLKGSVGSGVSWQVRRVARAISRRMKQSAWETWSAVSQVRRNLVTIAYHLNFYRLRRTELAGLHLGCGGLIIPEFWNMDGWAACRCDVVCGIGRLKLASGSVGIIYSSHVFEHVRGRLTERTLKEWHRVLKPGGKLYIAMPDLEALCRIYLDGLARYDTADGRFGADLAAGIMYGGQTNSYDFHYHGKSFVPLKAMLEAVGFTSVSLFDRNSLKFAPFRDAASAAIGGVPISLNVEATK